MTDLPEPLTPPDCDLRDYPWMPLDCRRLLTSELWVLGTPEQKCASVTLWAEAWQQLPAGSLPDNERMLAHLSMAGARWKAIAGEVLAKWVKCSDGRLYHPVVAEKAREAWALKRAQRERTAAAREAKAAARAGRAAGGSGSPVTEPVTTSVTENATDKVTKLVASGVTEKVTDSVTENVTGSTRQDSTRPDQESKKEPPSLREDPPPRRNGSRLPPNWCPSETECDFALGLGLDPNRVAAKFRDFWHAKPGQGGVKLDWTATWRNWCRDDAERRKPIAAEGPLTAMVRAERAASIRPETTEIPRILN